jgi:hypothetical protein
MRQTRIGRAALLMLVGDSEGAVQVVREQGVRVVDAPGSEEMVTPKAREAWQVWREQCSCWKDDDDDFV